MPNMVYDEAPPPYYFHDNIILIDESVKYDKSPVFVDNSEKYSFDQSPIYIDRRKKHQYDNRRNNPYNQSPPNVPLEEEYYGPPPPYCSPKRVPTVKKKQHAWVFPRGGRKQGRIAMAKDIFSSKGPAMYIATNHYGKAATVRDAPSRGLWSGWGDDVDSFSGGCCYSTTNRYYCGDLFPSKSGRSNQKYDYRSRKYKIPEPGDLKSVSHYTDRCGDRRVAEARMYRGDREKDLIMKFHPLEETRYTDPRNFHDRYLGGIGGAGSWWTRDMPGWEDEFWDKYPPYCHPVHRKAACF